MLWWSQWDPHTLFLATTKGNKSCTRFHSCRQANIIIFVHRRGWNRLQLSPHQKDKLLFQPQRTISFFFGDDYRRVGQGRQLVWVYESFVLNISWKVLLTRGSARDAPIYYSVAPSPSYGRMWRRNGIAIYYRNNIGMRWGEDDADALGRNGRMSLVRRGGTVCCVWFFWMKFTESSEQRVGEKRKFINVHVGLTGIRS